MVCGEWEREMDNKVCGTTCTNTIDSPSTFPKGAFILQPLRPSLTLVQICWSIGQQFLKIVVVPTSLGCL